MTMPVIFLEHGEIREYWHGVAWGRIFCTVTVRMRSGSVAKRKCVGELGDEKETRKFRRTG